VHRTRVTQPDSRRKSFPARARALLRFPHAHCHASLSLKKGSGDTNPCPQALFECPRGHGSTMLLGREVGCDGDHGDHDPDLLTHCGGGEAVSGSQHCLFYSVLRCNSVIIVTDQLIKTSPAA